MNARRVGVPALVLALACAALACAALPRGAAAADTAFHLPPPVTKKLDNGLTVAVFPMPRQPIIQIELLVEAGSAADPENAEGIANATARLLLQGTTSRTADDLALEIDKLAGSIEATASRDYATLDGAFLARDFEAGMELMSDALINPLLDPESLRRLQGDVMESIASVRRNPAAYADEQLWAAVYPGHPYGHALAGTPVSVARFDRDRALRFYLAQYRPERATLAIAGDVTPEKAFAAASEWFDRWFAKPNPPADAPPVVVPTPKLTIRIVDMPGMATSQVRIGAAAPARGADDEAAFTIANALFGGGASSRLAHPGAGDPRVPGARSAYTLLKFGGLFACACAAPNDSVGVTVQRVRDAIRRLATHAPTEAQIAPVRSTAAAVFPMRFETLGGVVGYWSASHFCGLSGEVDRDLERVRSVNAAAVTGAVKRWLDADRLAIVVVGPATVLRKQLERLGTVEIVSPESQGTATASGASTASTPAQQAKGKEVVRQALVAHGGLTRLRKIQDSTVEANATLTMGDREIRGDVVQIRKEPNRMLVHMQFGGLGTYQGLVGNRGWTSTEATSDVHEMDSLTVVGMQAGFAADVAHVLLATQAPGARVTYRSRQTVNGKETDAIEVRTAASRRLLYFGAQDHLLAAADQNEVAGGVGYVSRRLYRDYRTVQGVPWPHVEERQLDGRRVMLIEAKRVVLDSGVEDVVFERRTAPAPLPAR